MYIAIIENFSLETVVIILTGLLLLTLIIILIFSLSVFRYTGKFNDNPNINDIVQEQNNIKPIIHNDQLPRKQKTISIDDITDQDMMVAILVATIDYTNETKNDVRLVSIRQIS